MLTPKKRHRFGITIRVLTVPAVILNDSPGFRVPKGITGDTFVFVEKRVSPVIPMGIKTVIHVPTEK
jgi:hypothetical protein